MQLQLLLPALLLSFRTEAKESAVVLAFAVAVTSLTPPHKKNTAKNTSKFACQPPECEITAPILHNRVAYELCSIRYT